MCVVCCVFHGEIARPHQNNNQRFKNNLTQKGPSRDVDPGLARANQERMRAGPQLLRFNPWTLQAALEGNPQLLQMLTAMQAQAQQQQAAQQQEQQGGGSLSDGDDGDDDDDEGDDNGSGDDDDAGGGGGGGGGRPECPMS